MPLSWARARSRAFFILSVWVHWTTATAIAPQYESADGRPEGYNDGRPACGEQLTQKPLAGLFGTHTTRPISHSHLTKRPAVARATAGKVLAGGCTRQGQSTRRGLSSPSMRGITSTTWLFDRATWPSFSSSWQRWCHLRPSRPDLALTSVDRLRPQGTQRSLATTERLRRGRARFRQPP